MIIFVRCWELFDGYFWVLSALDGCMCYLYRKANQRRERNFIIWLIGWLVS